MHNILVTGANGQLGSEIKVISKEYPFVFYFTNKEELDITCQKNVIKYIIDNQIDTIINCAAYTEVDKAESDQEIAFKVNRDAVGFLAAAIQSVGGNMIHISTDYVFDGLSDRPYTPEDPVNPQNIYGKSKWEGEKIMRSLQMDRSLIIRTSWVYSEFGSNFVKTIIRLGKERESLKVVADQIGSPTYAADLARAILEILPRLEHQNVITYHYSNEGICSWFDFAKEIIKMAGFGCEINPIVSSEYPQLANRPNFSVLNKTKIKQDFSIDIPCWKDSLRRFFLNNSTN